MHKSKIFLLGIGLILSPVAYSKKDKYQAPSLPLKQEKALIKVQKEDLDSPKKFGQFEAEDARERELAGNDDSAAPEPKPEVKNEPVFMPERMRWKEKHN